MSEGESQKIPQLTQETGGRIGQVVPKGLESSSNISSNPETTKSDGLISKIKKRFSDRLNGPLTAQTPARLETPSNPDRRRLLRNAFGIGAAMATGYYATHANKTDARGYPEALTNPDSSLNTKVELGEVVEQASKQSHDSVISPEAVGDAPADWFAGVQQWNNAEWGVNVDWNEPERTRDVRIITFGMGAPPDGDPEVTVPASERYTTSALAAGGSNQAFDQSGLGYAGMQIGFANRNNLDGGASITGDWQGRPDNRINHSTVNISSGGSIYHGMIEDGLNKMIAKRQSEGNTMPWVIVLPAMEDPNSILRGKVNQLRALGNVIFVGHNFGGKDINTTYLTAADITVGGHDRYGNKVASTGQEDVFGITRVPIRGLSGSQTTFTQDNLNGQPGHEVAAIAAEAFQMGITNPDQISQAIMDSARVVNVGGETRRIIDHASARQRFRDILAGVPTPTVTRTPEPTVTATPGPSVTPTTEPVPTATPRADHEVNLPLIERP